MVPLNNLLRATRCSLRITTLSRSFTTEQLVRNSKAGEPCRKVDCNLSLREFKLKPKPPFGCKELRSPPKKALPCMKPNPCADIRPKPKRYPWEYLMEVGITLALLLCLSYLYYRMRRKDIYEELKDIKYDIEQLEKDKKKKGKKAPLTWVQHKGGEFPENAVIGGFHNEDLYVGRAEHGGDLIPGKVLKSQATCYVAWGGLEFGKHEFEVLTGSNLKWVPVKGVNLPPNGVEGGYTVSGETYYIGRTQHNGIMTIGKIHPSHRVALYIPFEGKEYESFEYEMLVIEEQ